MLLQAYENMKKKAKKVAADSKVERMKTGGGQVKVKVDEMTEKLLAVLGNRARPLANPYDGDADYNCEGYGK